MPEAGGYPCECGWAGTPEAVLDAASGLDPTLRLLGGACPQCKRAFEVRPERGVLRFGYSYFGGSMHFEAVKDVKVPSLEVAWPAPNEIEVALGPRRWRLSAAAESSEWMYVFPTAWGVGKMISALRFDEIGVRITHVERNWKPLFFDHATVLHGGERLLVIGRTGALRRAWARLHEGKE
ncbi:MAG: TrkA C-terminal domain-containing protein [Vicinamibacteria bacterium]